MDNRISADLPDKVREAVDTIYEMTLTACPRGISSWENPARYVGTLLSKRGVIKNLGSNRKPAWHWASDMAPTDNLYKTVLSDYRELYCTRKKRTPRDPAQKGLRAATLSDYATQDLWDELKRRGVQVGEDGKLYMMVELN